MNICYIFGSLAVHTLSYEPGEGDLIIAADRGYETLRKLCIAPDIVLGDFDSLKYTPKGDNVIKYPVMKDDTDLLLAIKAGLKKGYKDFIIYGCIGGDRLDHTFASIQSAAYIKDNGGSCWFIDNDTTITLLENETIHFDKNQKGYISVFSYSEKATVSINGLQYNITQEKLSQSYPLGVSNHFIGEEATITAHMGRVLIITKEEV